MQYKGMNLCDFCFSPVNQGESCAVCGFTHENYKYLYNKILMPGTILLGKYIIGRVLKKDESRTAYLACTPECARVVVTEYLPSAYLERNPGEDVVTVCSDRNNEFFKGAQEFVENAETLKKGGKDISDIFYTNGTVYYCTRYEIKAADKTLDMQSKAAEEAAAKPYAFEKTTNPAGIISTVPPVKKADALENKPESAFRVPGAVPERPEPEKADMQEAVLCATLGGNIRFTFPNAVPGNAESSGAIVYNHSERVVRDDTGNFGEVKEMSVPEDVNTLDGLVSLMLKEHPEWKETVDSYLASKVKAKAPESGIQDIHSAFVKASGLENAAPESKPVKQEAEPRAEAVPSAFRRPDDLPEFPKPFAGDTAPSVPPIQPAASVPVQPAAEQNAAENPVDIADMTEKTAIWMPEKSEEKQSASAPVTVVAPEARSNVSSAPVRMPSVRKVYSNSLDSDIVFIEVFADGNTDIGPDGSSARLEYRAFERAVVYSITNTRGGVQQDVVRIPDGINNVRALINYTLGYRPEWDVCFADYLENLEAEVPEVSGGAGSAAIFAPVNNIQKDSNAVIEPSAPERMEDIDLFDGSVEEDFGNAAAPGQVYNMQPAAENAGMAQSFPPNLDTDFDRIPMQNPAGIPEGYDSGLYNQPMYPAVNGGYYGEYPVKKKKKLFPLFMIIGGAVCTVLIVVIVLLLVFRSDDGKDNGGGAGQPESGYNVGTGENKGFNENSGNPGNVNGKDNNPGDTGEDNEPKTEKEPEESGEVANL